MKRTFVLLAPPHPSRQRAVEAVQNAPDGYVVTVGEATRKISQNAAQWPLLHAIATQRQWPVNGAMSWLSEEAWKDILTAAFTQEQARVAMAYGGQGLVMLGHRTREFGKKEFSEWLDFLNAAAIDLGVEI